MATQRNTDTDYNEILKELDEANVEVSDWEAHFIESNLYRKSFSDKQKIIIEKMEEKYLK